MAVLKLRAIDLDYCSRILQQRLGGGFHDASFSGAGGPEEQKVSDRPADRLEQEDLRFFAAIAAAYDELAAAEPERIVVIDAGQAPEAVLADALAAL